MTEASVFLLIANMSHTITTFHANGMVTEVECSQKELLKMLQTSVGGAITSLRRDIMVVRNPEWEPLLKNKNSLYCNEDGMNMRLPPNPYIGITQTRMLPGAPEVLTAEIYKQWSVKETYHVAGAVAMVKKNKK